MKYLIYRLKDKEEIAPLLFVSSASLKKSGWWPIDPENYQLIWEGSNPGSDHSTLLGWIYAKFNVAKPLLFRSRHHSMSVGDIVVLIGEKSGAYFCDSFGWTAIPEFLKSVSTAK